MNVPDLALAPRGERAWSAAVEYIVTFAITSHLVLTPKPGKSNPAPVLATRLSLRWTWHDGEWRLDWAFHGRRFRKTKNDWSPHEQGYLHDWNFDLPEWVLPVIDANAPTMTPTAGGEA